jgi:2,3-bisphosphoglycerate-independent phosphoglycerate mutase
VVAVLVILDGASEPVGDGPTSLEAARTPALDALAAAGSLSRLRTVAPGLPAGSETAIPALLGWRPPAPVDRGAVEAAAHEAALAAGERAWRVDVLDYEGGRAGAVATERAAADLRAALAPHHTVHRLAGHRLLVVGSDDRRSLGPGDEENVAHRLRWWPAGVVPPRVLDPGTVVVGARGAATGVARLMGARVVVPAGATGDVGTDLSAKAAAALAAIEAGAARVVVHVGAPDEAAHALDLAGKVSAIERADGELIPPLAKAVRTAGGTLRVCPDHDCDPATGLHDDAPVPCLDWPAAGGGRPGARLTERAVAALPVAEIAAPEAVAV